MYNRYIPDGTSYTRVTEEEIPSPPKREEPRPAKQEPPHEERPPSSPQTPSGQPQTGPRPGPKPGYQQGPFGTGGFKLPPLFGGKDGLNSLFSGKGQGGLSSLLKALKLEEIDTGDILLLLIVLYLLVEGDDLELVIALGLVLIMGLGDKGKGEEPA